MDLISQSVKHKTFGTGRITDQIEDRLIINFDNFPEAKTFSYPNSIGTFLTLLDADVNNRIIKEVEDKKVELLKEEEEKRTALIVNQAFASLKLGIDRPFTSVNEFCEKSIKEISTESEFLRTNGGKRIRIFNGERIESVGKKYTYIFESDSELHLPDGTQITLWTYEADKYATIISCEDYNIIFSTNEDLGSNISALEFSAEPWKLLDALNDRLSEIAVAPSNIVKALICGAAKEIDIHGFINKGQKVAQSLASSQPITFIWGPPGTGKTQTLASIAISNIIDGNRVLMLSYSNVSVDGAILRVFEEMKGATPGMLVRYGYPRQKDLLSHEYLTSFNLALHNSPELLEERTRLNKECSGLSKNSSKYIEISKRLSQIRNVLKEQEKEIAHSASFVATTISKAIIDKDLYTQKFDVVIFDEASMATIPQIAFAASLAQKHFVCLGDFCQLPPIVQYSNKSFLNTDIFQYCGITLAVDRGWKHNWMCMLDEQYRMHPQIASFIGSHMYHNLLKSGEKVEESRKDIVLHQPLSNLALGLIDLSGMMSVCTKTSDSSRINVLSAFIACDLAMQAAQRYNVGIITPYNAQSRLIRTMIRDVAKQNPQLCPITCATVHQFQGSEQDVIIYDAVDCYRMSHPGMLLTSLNNDYANRLFNVAMSRAKGKFVAITNAASYMTSKKLSEKMLFSKFIHTMDKPTTCIKGDKILQIKDSGSFSFLKLADAEKAFLLDIEMAKSEVRIDIPGEINASEDFMCSLYTCIKNAKARGIKVYIRGQKQHLPQLREIVIENNFISNPVSIIDKRVIWFGEPSSADCFVSLGQKLKTHTRPIIRFVGAYTAQALFALLEFNRTVSQTTAEEITSNGQVNNFAEYVIQNTICPECQKPMKLFKSKKGKIFCVCTAYPKCKKTDLVTVNFLNEYLYTCKKGGMKCPTDGTSLEAKLGNYGVYVKCCGITGHYFKLDEI